MKKILKYKSDIIGYISSIIIIVGTIVPIVTINGVSQSFISENGKLVLACAVIGAILYLFKVGFFSFIPAIGTLLILFIFYYGINDSMTALNELNAGSAKYGIGFYLIIVGAALLIFSSILSFIDYRKNKKLNKNVHNVKLDENEKNLQEPIQELFNDNLDNFENSVPDVIEKNNNVINENVNVEVSQQQVQPINQPSLSNASNEFRPIPITDIFQNNINSENTSISESNNQSINQQTNEPNINNSNNIIDGNYVNNQQQVMENPNNESVHLQQTQNSSNVNDFQTNNLPENILEYKKCNNCGAIIKRESQICSFCGNKQSDNIM